MSKDTKAPSRSADQFVVRFPDGMRERIANEAKKNNRSMNAEIIARLDDSFSAPDESHTIGQTAKLLVENTKLRLEMAKLRNTVRPRRSGSETHEQAAADPSATPVLLHQMLEVTEGTEKLRREVGALLDLLTSALTPEEAENRLREYQKQRSENHSPTRAPTPPTRRLRLPKKTS
ncbi:TPA: Arc family DNA-binding protein [Burkholderia cenocepacia]|nr:Arc family DNA-binding protein [Burkholderia cenocepacia]HDR9884513.1 Arc family DNA-binding protein [Burkholderia cenocepacia]